MTVTDFRRVGTCDLDSVIITDQLEGRSSRRPHPELETAVLLKLHRELAVDPQSFFQKLVEAVLELSRPGSAGISLLKEVADCFVWPAVAGPLSRFVGDGTPRDFGPCGTVLDRDMTLLMAHPERHFSYLEPITPSLEEVLLVPFYVDGRAVGTIWAVSHIPSRKFDAEDRRLVESLSDFAASAYETLANADQLEPLLRRKLL